MTKSNNKSFVSDLIKNLPPSGIRKYFDIAETMEDVVSLGVGEPDFDTPWNVTEAAIYSLEKGHTHYTSNSGLLKLRHEISEYMNRKFGLNYDEDTEILISVGASEVIDVTMRAILNPGDEVLVVEPCFVSYKPCVVMAGGVAVPITTTAEHDFRLQPEQLIEKITPKTKAIIMGYPNNPTGAIMEKEDLEKIADVLRDKDILIISDEIYAELNYSQNDHVSIASLEGMRDKTIVLNGFSKAFAMTGWRLGFACGTKDLLEAITKIHQYIIMCAPTVSQYAGIEALRNGDKAVLDMTSDYDARRRLLLEGFRKIGMDCFEPKGAFYAFPSIQKTGMTSAEFCEKLLYEERVATVPGNAFGDCGEGFIRCSYACSLDNIQEALRRIGRFINK